MTQRLPGIGLPASDLASDGVSGSECYERSKTFVTLSLSGYLFSTDSVHVVLCGLFIGRTCRSHRTVCHRCKFRYSISNADLIFDPFGQKWPIATHPEDLSPEEIQKRAADRFGLKPAEHQQPWKQEVVSVEKFFRFSADGVMYRSDFRMKENQLRDLNQLESHLWESTNIRRGPVDAADCKGYSFLYCSSSSSPLCMTRSIKRRSWSPVQMRDEESSVNILDPKEGGSSYDRACGTGGMLLEAILIGEDLRFRGKPQRGRGTPAFKVTSCNLKAWPWPGIASTSPTPSSSTVLSWLPPS